jgi:hypothetical protein
MYLGAGIECFGERKWCLEDGVFNTEYGIYTKGGAPSRMYRGILSGNCYKWQLQNHDCAPNEVAINNGGEWACLTQRLDAGAAASAVKAKTIRRTAVSPIIRK